MIMVMSTIIMTITITIMVITTSRIISVERAIEAIGKFRHNLEFIQQFTS